MRSIRNFFVVFVCIAIAFLACANSGPSFTAGPDGGSSGCDTAHPLSCPSGCVDPTSDGANCGACGNACPTGTACKQGACTCANGQASCGSACTNTQTDPSNCGKCGNACPAGQVCSMGTCAAGCMGGLTQCGQSCVDPTKDPANCGGCGKACPTVANAMASCNAGMCSYACNPGWGDLGDAGSDGGVVCNCHSTATPQNPDKPDLGFIDENCDGIDGTIADAIFVSTHGNNANTGTIQSPVQTITKGLALASTSNPPKDVYVAKGTYTEEITLASGIGIYGAYDDTNGWSRALTNATIIQSPNPIGVLGSGLNASLELQLLTVTASDGANAGDSSYGVLITGSSAGTTVTVRACNVSSGNGVAGGPGSDGSNGGAGTIGGQGDQSRSQAPGGGGCNSGGHGGAAVVGSTTGPGGGNGGGAAPGLGGGGGSTPGTCGGNGGTGAPANNTQGGTGTNGLQGTAAPNAGTFMGGAFGPASGSAGTKGTDGSGGGGGGSGAGDSDVCVAIPPCCDQTSGGGGGGGGGGCAGTPGTGGQGGGGSFAIAAMQSMLDVEGSSLTTAAGGTGGHGGNGGNGGNPGPGGGGGTGTGSSGAGAQGAPGGGGGNSGAGAGGSGGPSICIAYTANSIPTQNQNNCAPGTGGAAGSGGFSPMLGNAANGNPGPAGKVHQF